MVISAHSNDIHSNTNMLLEEESFMLINTIVFTVIGVVIVFVLIFSLVIIIKNFKPDLCKCCCKDSSEPKKNQVVTISKNTNEKKKESTGSGKQYLTLEEHLDTILDTPIRKKSEKKETHGYTLEFFPDDNTVVQVEGTKSKITKITKTKITFGELVSQQSTHAVFSGELNDNKVLIFIVSLNDTIYEEIKTYVMERDRGLPMMISHPRYLRYLGTCFNPQKLEAYIISDYVAGPSLLDIQMNSVLRELLSMTEEDKIQAALDVTEAVYFIHNLSNPIVHQNVSAKNIVIDGETLRGRLRAPEIQERLEDMLWCINHGGIKDFFNRTNILHIELPPEMFLDPSNHPDTKSDIWSLGASILEILFDKKLWNDKNLAGKMSSQNSSNTFEILQRAMEKRMKPCLVETLDNANPQLRFISDCFAYNPGDRPSVTLLLKNLQSFHDDTLNGAKASAASVLSFIFPNKRIASGLPRSKADPLLRQQVEWNVRQETGYKRRAFLVGNRSYLGRHWPTLSANPTNDVKDLDQVLRRGGYVTQNIYENITSASNFEEILSSYVDAVNREEEVIDIIVFYFSGYGIVGEPERLRAKKSLNIFTDRQGLIYDSALVMCNETLFSVTRIQILLSRLGSHVKRKLILLDSRVSSIPPKPSSSTSPEELLNRTLMRAQSTISTVSGYQDMLDSQSSAHSSASIGIKAASTIDWELPKIPEETTERLSSMFILMTSVSDAQVILKAVDSHPRRMNGFLTGCLLQVLSDHSPNISELPKFLNNQMKSEARRSRAHRGIECRAEFSRVGNIWAAPLLPQ